MGSPFVAGYSGLITPSVSVPGAANVGLIGPPGATGPVAVTGFITIQKDPGAFIWGYQDRSAGNVYGSISPPGATYDGVLIGGISQVQSSKNIQFFLVGIGHPQDFFTSLFIDDPDGGDVTLLTASADNFGSTGGDTFWLWNNQDPPINWTGGGDDGQNANYTITP